VSIELLPLRSLTEVNPVGYPPRQITEAIAVHHSAVNLGGVPMDAEAERQYLIGIHNYHVAKGFGGIGYHVAVFPSGRAYRFGDENHQRAGVWTQNWRLAHVVLIGDFTYARPAEAQLAGGRRVIAFLRYGYGPIPYDSHRGLARTDDPTACPGDTWLEWRGALEAPPEEEPGEYDWIQGVRWTAIELTAAGQLDELAAMLSGLGFGKEG
jgi:hypothetical protein